MSKLEKELLADSKAFCALAFALLTEGHWTYSSLANRTGLAASTVYKLYWYGPTLFTRIGTLQKLARAADLRVFPAKDGGLRIKAA